jgi:hypothetical protein
MVVGAACVWEVLVEQGSLLNTSDSDKLASDDGLPNRFTLAFAAQFIDCTLRPVTESVQSTG